MSGRFRVPAEVAASLVARFRRERTIALVGGAVVVALSAGALVYGLLTQDGGRSRCERLYAEARSYADTLAVDTMKVVLREDPDHGERPQPRCEALRVQPPPA